MKKNNFILFLIIALLAACTTTFPAKKSNISDDYNPDRFFPDLNTQVFHFSPDSSRLYLRFSKTNLLYQRPEPDEPLEANWSVSFLTYASYDTKEVTDSLQVIIKDTMPPGTGQSEYIQTFVFRRPASKNGLVEIRVHDQNRNRHINRFVETGTNPGYKQNAILLNTEGLPLFSNRISSGQSFVYRSNRYRNNVFIRKYKMDFPIALPAYVTSGEKKPKLVLDTIFSHKLKHNVSEVIQLDEGLYIFSDDSSKLEGDPIIVFDQNYPMIKSSSKMLYPLRYISTKKEFKEMDILRDKKYAVEQFWLDIAGNPGRASKLIKLYYNRVQEANNWFFSYHEGWKTDRGMVYIIFGQPEMVYRDNEREVWIYGEAGNANSIRFSFRKVQNPFSSNDYSLQRSPAYKDAWFRAVEHWRR